MCYYLSTISMKIGATTNLYAINSYLQTNNYLKVNYFLKPLNFEEWDYTVG